MEIHVSFKKFMTDMEVKVLSYYLEKYNKNVTRAANALKLNRTTLVEKLKKHNMLPTCRTRKKM